MHLERLEREVGWDAIVTADHDAERAKPRPTLYLEALEQLGVAADEAIAFEDSPNGALAREARGHLRRRDPERGDARARARGTADLVVDSLADLPPDELLARF